MSRLGRPPVMLDIVMEHFEELDCLWELRESIIFAPDWTLADLAELEERAEAHLDGLRLAELHAIDIARPHLAGEHVFAATAATFVFMESDDEDFQREVVLAFAKPATPEALQGIRIGLRHSRIDRIVPQLQALTDSALPSVAVAAADVLEFHQIPCEPRLPELLASPDPAIVSLAWQVAGRLRVPLPEQLLEQAFLQPDHAVARSAFEWGCRIALPNLRTICLAAATRAPNPCGPALEFLGVLGHLEDVSLLHRCAGDPQLAPSALRGIGAMGAVESVPILIEAMRNPLTAKAAGAAFQRMTGAEDIRSDRKPLKLASEDPAAAELEDDEPPPDAAHADAWWQDARSRGSSQSSVSSGQLAPESASSSSFEGSLAVRRDLAYRACARGSPACLHLNLESRAVALRP